MQHAGTSSSNDKSETWFVKTQVNLRASLVSQMVKNLPAMKETWVRSLAWDDPLEKKMTTHSSILAKIIPWTEDLVGYRTQGFKELGTTERRTHTHTHTQINLLIWGQVLHSNYLLHIRIHYKLYETMSFPKAS